MNNWIIQLIGLAGTALYFISFQFKSNRALFRVQFLSYAFYTAHMLLLGAVTGGVSYVINLIRSLCLASRVPFLRSRKMCAILCAMQLLVPVFTWSGPISLLPVAANIASTVGGYTGNGRKIRFAGIFINSPLWIIYDILVGSWAGLLDEALSETSMIASCIRYGGDELDRVQD